VSKPGDKLLALHHGLETAGIAHAFGGAIALAYCTQLLGAEHPSYVRLLAAMAQPGS
jgi:hypothetical protein